MANPMCFKTRGNGRASPRNGVTGKDAMGRVIQRGLYRDVPPSSRMDDFSTSQSMPATKVKVYTPITNFQWELPEVLVTSIPTEVKGRQEKFRFVA